MPVTLGELADRFDCQLVGDASVSVDHVATLTAAGPGAVSFFANPLFRDKLRLTRASAVIVPEDAAADCPVAALIHNNPYATYARIAAYLVPPKRVDAGVHASASVADSADVSKSAEVGPQAVIGEAARIGDRVVIGAGSVIGDGVVVGADTRIYPRVVVLDHVDMGCRCIVHSGVVIGADGFGFALDAGEWVKVPQVGTVKIGDDVEIGANSTIDRGTIEATVIENGVKLDNLVQIAHNVRIGAHSIMAAMSGAAGSTRIGKRCMVGGGAVMINHLEICDDVLITFRSVVTKSISRSGTYSGSLPADEAPQWRRNAARFRSLDKLAARIRGIEKTIKQLSERVRRDDE